MVGSLDVIFLLFFYVSAFSLIITFECAFFFFFESLEFNSHLTPKALSTPRAHTPSLPSQPDPTQCHKFVNVLRTLEASDFPPEGILHRHLLDIFLRKVYEDSLHWAERLSKILIQEGKIRTPSKVLIPEE